MKTLYIYIATVVALITLAVIVTVVYSAQYSVSRSYTININISAEFNSVQGQKANPTILQSITASAEFNSVQGQKANPTILQSITASTELRRIARNGSQYIVYTVACLSINVTRSSGQTQVVLNNSCVTTGSILTVSLSYIGYICSSVLNGYIHVFDSVTGTRVASLYMPSSNNFNVVLERNRTYIVSFPMTVPCISGSSCIGNLSAIYIGGMVYTSGTVTVTMTGSTSISAIYNIYVVPPCRPALMVLPFSSVSAGECPDKSGLCYWFGTSIAIRYSCTAFGETYISIYEYQHSEEIKIFIGETQVATLTPSTHQSYKQRFIKAETSCPLCIAAVNPSCRIVSLAPQQGQQQIIELPELTIVPPSVGISTPGIESPQGLIMIGSIVGLFAFLVRRLRWTQALFITAVVLTAMGMLLLGSPQLFAVGMVIAVASVVVDKYM